jgi:hypothetical protein
VIIIMGGVAKLAIDVVAPPGGSTGYNWPNAGRVYVGHFDQLSVRASDAAAPLRAGRANDLGTIRVFLGDDVVFNRWREAPDAALADIARLVADAQRNHVRLVLSNYLTPRSIAALAGHGFKDDATARRDLVTPGSPSWEGLASWLDAVVPRFAGSSAIASWEVMNEPGFMLGVDAGDVGVAEEMHFLDFFQGLLKQRGADTVNGGGRPAFDPSRLTDADVRLYAAHLDVLDDHLYPAAADDGPAEAAAEVNRTAAWFQRVEQVTGRSFPATIGELGSADDTWFTAALADARGRGWTVLAWGYDAYDPNAFTVTQRPQVLSELQRRR